MKNEEIENLKNKLFMALDNDNSYSMESFMSEINETNSFDYSKLNFKFVNNSKNEPPKYETDGSSGFDIRANLEKPVILKSGERVAIPTGLYFEIPLNFEIQIRPRSGLAYKHGVTVLNTPGTIDADYRGELKIILINHGKEDFTINNGDRIAQGVIASVISKQMVNLIKVDAIDKNTNRGEGGFGSTGTN